MHVEHFAVQFACAHASQMRRRNFVRREWVRAHRYSNHGAQFRKLRTNPVRREGYFGIREKRTADWRALRVGDFSHGVLRRERRIRMNSLYRTQRGTSNVCVLDRRKSNWLFVRLADVWELGFGSTEHLAQPRQRKEDEQEALL